MDLDNRVYALSFAKQGGGWQLRGIFPTREAAEIEAALFPDELPLILVVDPANDPAIPLLSGV